LKTEGRARGDRSRLEVDNDVHNPSQNRVEPDQLGDSEQPGGRLDGDQHAEGHRKHPAQHQEYCAPNAHGEREQCDELKDAGDDGPGRSTLALVLFQNGGKLRAERGSSRCSLCISRDCSPPGTQFISVLK
jgi:hypothetical protein